VIVTADEVPDIDALEVVTEHNGGICSRDFVRNMKTRPLDLVAFHSDFFTLHPGDIISTGCPKGARIQAGRRGALAHRRHRRADRHGQGRRAPSLRLLLNKSRQKSRSPAVQIQGCYTQTCAGP
jgi:2-keto-4-pentenoate hydratase/2-oxohepta-3-ene-1,7-dioic acid hydratase in catechol pathway